MNAQERLRDTIDVQRSRLRAGIPADRERGVGAIVTAVERRAAIAPPPMHSLVTGRRFGNLGGNLAIQLCVEADADGQASSWPADDDLNDWADRLLDECERLAEAELVLTHSQTGFMQLVEDGDGTFTAWIATKRVPSSWRERADIDWWARWLARQNASPDAAAYLRRMEYQLNYPLDATLGGCTIRSYRDVLGLLIKLAIEGEGSTTRSERELIDRIVAALPIGPVTARHALDGFTLSEENAAYHAAVPGVAPAPLVRIGEDRIVLSRHGLTTEPFFFLTRELRRRDAEEYNNTAHLREGIFREDLYALFHDKRFVTSPGRIELRRESGSVRTDVDAVVFDRKTGTLGFFELKSQDPFARSAAELTRQRDNVLYANRQISGVLAWLNRSGAADELLNRVDRRTAKTFRVNKVYPFVLGRYLAHFNDGPEPDRRAAWGVWPQLLRLLDGQPATGSNPLASLFTRLQKDTPVISPPTNAPARTIAIGDARLTVYPTYAAFQASERVERH